MPNRMIDMKCLNCGHIIEDLRMREYNEIIDCDGEVSCPACVGEMLRIYTPHPPHSSWK